MKNFEEYFMAEMALTDFKKIGKWNDPKNRHGYDKQSVAILNSDAGVKKIQDKFNNINIADFNLYFVKKPNASQYAEYGKVSPEQVFEYTGLVVGEEIPTPAEDSITVIFTNNRAAEKVPLTYWTIAHRIGHAFDATERRNFRSGRYRDTFMRRLDNLLDTILRECYDYNISKSSYGRELIFLSKPEIRNFFESIGKFRSARMKKINRTGEFIYECFAQYLLSNGNLTFNDFPKYIKTSNKKAWGNDTGMNLRLQDADAAENLKTELIDLMSDYFSYLIGSHINSINIM
jgi:hypothetical protein